MTEKMIIDAYCRIRTIDQTTPDDVLDFMKDAAIEKLRKHVVSGCCCSNCCKKVEPKYNKLCDKCEDEFQNSNYR